jgi:hypothetical protein
MRYESVVLRHLKTVKLDVTLSDDCRVEDIIISGDFFAYPEDTIERLEGLIKGCEDPHCVERAFSAISPSTILGVDVEKLKLKVIEILERCRKQNANNL